MCEEPEGFLGRHVGKEENWVTAIRAGIQGGAITEREGPGNKEAIVGPSYP